jgi:TonB family protein
MMDRYSRNCRSRRGPNGWITVATWALLFALMPGFTPQAAAQNAAKPKRKVVTMVEPEYPFVLRNGHFEGQVKLEATVLPSGSVSKVDIKGGNPMLSQYASQAVLRWKYAPGPDKTVEEVVFSFNASSGNTK